MGIEDWVSGIGDWVSDNENYYYENDIKEGQDEFLQGTESLAVSDEFGSDDLRNDSRLSKDRNLRNNKSDSESGSINTGKHSRGLRKGFEKGISLSSVGGTRLDDRVGNSLDNNSTIKLHRRNQVQRNLGTNSNYRQTVNGTSKVSQTQNPIP